MRFAICPLQMCKVPHLSREISEANLNYLMLHNATIARRSAPWPPNMFDGDVSCAAPAMRNASLQILSKAEHLLVFETAPKNHTFGPLLKAQAPLPLPWKTMLERSKVSGHVIFLPCWFRNLLPATDAMHFFNNLTSKKVLREWSASDFEMRSAPETCALSQPLNFQKCSEAESFLALCCGNVLRATAACTFCAADELPKVLRTRCAFMILTWKCVSRHNRVQFSISRPARWLRAAALSNQLFDPPEPQSIHSGTRQSFETFLTSRIWSSFCWLFLSLPLAISRKFVFKFSFDYVYRALVGLDWSEKHCESYAVWCVFVFIPFFCYLIIFVHIIIMPFCMRFCQGHHL